VSRHVPVFKIGSGVRHEASRFESRMLPLNTQSDARP